MRCRQFLVSVYLVSFLPFPSILALVANYSCSANEPCVNRACCGVSGYCGYGPEYCGAGCQSNCDAYAECGRYASDPGQTCPHDACCSQEGSCGTTAEFCDASQGCQSNCGYLNAHGNLSTLVNSPQLDNGIKPASRALGGAFDTGQICTVSDCNTGNSCQPGYTALSVRKGQPTQPTYGCPTGQHREVCCPSAAVPQGCIWRGSWAFCGGSCKDGEVTLTRDESGDGWTCWTGTKALCCPETTEQDISKQCDWFGTAPLCNGTCPTSGSTLSNQVTTGGGGGGNGMACVTGRKALCCPNPSPYQGCAWHGTAPFCDGKCPDGKVMLYSDTSGDGYWCAWGKKVYCCDPPNALVNAAVLEFEANIQAFAAYPNCDRVSDTIDRLVKTLYPLLLSVYIYFTNPSFGDLNAEQLAEVDAFAHTSPEVWGNVSIVDWSRRLQSTLQATSVADPLDPRAEVRDMICEASNSNNNTLGMLVLSDSVCMIQTCGVTPSACSATSARSDDMESSVGQDEGDVDGELHRRSFDENFEGHSPGGNGEAPSLFTVINAILSGGLPLAQFQYTNTADLQKKPVIQLQVVFTIPSNYDYEGHQIAQYTRTTTVSVPSGLVRRDPDRFVVLQIRFVEPPCDIRGHRIQINNIEMFHGQHAGVGLNRVLGEPGVVQVGLIDALLSAREGFSRMNRHSTILHCPNRKSWSVENCATPRIPHIARPGWPLSEYDTPADRQCLALVERLVRWLRSRNVLTWEDGLDYMWDPGARHPGWFRDDAHRFGPRYGPTGDPEYDIGPSQLRPT